jgi:hypothetical protein
MERQARKFHRTPDGLPFRKRGLKIFTGFSVTITNPGQFITIHRQSNFLREGIFQGFDFRMKQFDFSCGRQFVRCTT